MSDGEIIEKIASISEQIHDLKKTHLKNGSAMQINGTKFAARAWLTKAEKFENMWPETASSVLEMTKKDRKQTEKIAGVEKIELHINST